MNGDNSNEDDFSSFELSERIENKDKVAEMFMKKKMNVPIPDINVGVKENASNKSGESVKTNATKEKQKMEEEKAPVDFYFKPMGAPPASYIKYTPKVVPIHGSQHYDRVDFMMLADQWEEIRAQRNNISENMKDIVEEIIDKLEKFTEKGDPQPFEK